MKWIAVLVTQYSFHNGPRALLQIILRSQNTRPSIIYSPGTDCSKAD